MDQAQALREAVKKYNVQLNKVKSHSRVRTFVVTSGKGGVGKSNISYNLSIALSTFGKKVLLFDADLGLANLDLLMGISIKNHWGAVVSGAKKLEQIVQRGPENIYFIPGGSGIKELAHLRDDERGNIMHSLLKLGKRMDFVFVDTGAGISKNVLSFLSVSKEIIIVTTPEPTALLDAYSLIKILSEDHCDVLICLLLNMVQDKKEGQQVGETVITLARHHAKLNVIYLGCVVKDNNLIKSVRMQQPFLKMFPNSPAALCVMQIAHGILKMQT